jgi:hypothetical protein
MNTQTQTNNTEQQMLEVNEIIDKIISSEQEVIDNSNDVNVVETKNIRKLDGESRFGGVY